MHWTHFQVCMILCVHTLTSSFIHNSIFVDMVMVAVDIFAACTNGDVFEVGFTPSTAAVLTTTTAHNDDDIEKQRLPSMSSPATIMRNQLIAKRYYPSFHPLSTHTMNATTILDTTTTTRLLCDVIRLSLTCSSGSSSGGGNGGNRDSIDDQCLMNVPTFHLDGLSSSTIENSDLRDSNISSFPIPICPQVHALPTSACILLQVGAVDVYYNFHSSHTHVPLYQYGGCVCRIY